MSEHDETCRLVDEHMGEVLEGTADAVLLEHIADCELCRDARFEAERSLATLRLAGADYVPPKNLEQRLLAALPDAPEALPLHDAPKVVADAPKVVLDAPKAPPDAPKPVPLASKAKQVLRSRWVAWAGAATLAAAALLWWRAPDSRHSERTDIVPIPGSVSDWNGKVSQIASGFGSSRGLEICDASGSGCARAKLGQAFASGARLYTDGLTRAKLELSDGSVLALDRATELRLSADGRHGKLVNGNLVADVKTHGDVVRLDLPQGRAEVLGTKFALQAGNDFARVDVSRGEVRLVDSHERSVSVLAGESGELTLGKAPTATAVGSLEAALAWSDEAFVEDSSPTGLGLRGLGELVAKKPGEQREQGGAVRLSRHDVKVRVVNNIAKTTVEEVFSNTTDEVLEGIFRFPLPPDAQIERLALEVDGKLMEGAFVERERAGKIWRGAIVNATQKAPKAADDIIWVPGRWKDPALLEWQRGGRFELRIFPIPKQGSRRIVLAYTQRLAPHGSVRRYTYPLAHDPSGSTTVGQFNVDVEVRGHDREFGVHALGYALGSGTPSEGAAVLRYSAQGFVPSGDLALEYRLAGDERELRAWAYAPSTPDITRTQALSAGKAVAAPRLPADAPYVALSLRPKLPRWIQGQRRAFVLALDSSRSMYGEHFQRASKVVERIVREMDSEDQVTVLACDTTCRALPGGFMQPGPDAEATVRGFLEGLTPEGASDLVNTLVEASALKREVADRAFRVVYVGDGTPTVGSVVPSFISRELKQRLPAGTTVHAVSVGADADLGAIEAATEAGGGVVVPYAPGRSAASVAFAVLGAAYGNSLEDVSLELPPGLVEVTPQRLGSIASGSEALVVARMLTPRLSGKVRLRGKLGGQSYEQSYPLELEATGGAGNAFVPRLFAATRIAELGKSPLAEARAESVELSRAFSVASRYTSLLVLESPAMFEAFGLDTTRTAPEWSGEDSIAESEGDGEVKYEAGPSPPPAPAAKPAPRSAEPMAGLGSGAGRSAAANSAPMDSFGDDKPRLLERTRRWVPMRRVWERTARIHAGDQPPKGGSPEAVARAEAHAEQNPQSRAARKELYVAQFLAGRLAEAQATAERWSEQDPLDPEALTARADVAAQRGDRKLAIRLLDSVIDVRPDDYKAQWRLARLQRWRGQALQGCRYSTAVAQMHPSDLERVTAALRCTRAIGDTASFEDLRSMAPAALRARLDQALAKTPPDDVISGDFRLEASWEGEGAQDVDDIDLVIVHPDGFRVSWLGAPTRAVISARDVLSTRHEALGLSGAKAGSYAIELVRNAGAIGTVSGDVRLTVGNQVRSLSFKLEGNRVRVATVDLSFTSRLVPVN